MMHKYFKLKLGLVVETCIYPASGEYRQPTLSSENLFIDSG